jgi:hypothetical protein
MPSRWLMPSEKPLDRLPAMSSSPTMPMTSSTRRRGMALVSASQSRCLYALRPPCTALASSRMTLPGHPLVIWVRPGMKVRPVHFQRVVARPDGQQVALAGM